MPRKKASLWLRPLELLSVAAGTRPTKRTSKPRPAAKRAVKPVARPAATVRPAGRTGTVHPARVPAAT